MNIKLIITLFLIIFYFIYYKSEIEFKNILFFGIIILIIYNFNNYDIEHLTIDESLSNIAQIYNSEKMIVKDLEVTGNLKVVGTTILNGDTTIEKLNSSNIYTDNINSLSENSINVNNDIIMNKNLFANNNLHINDLWTIGTNAYGLTFNSPENITLTLI
jgi:hypothetical protein